MKVSAVSVSRCLEGAAILSHSVIRQNAKVFDLFTLHFCSPNGLEVGNYDAFVPTSAHVKVPGTIHYS